MRNYFTFDSTTSTSFGVYISGSGTFSAPERAYNLINIPARNGALVGLDKRFENIEVTYPAFSYTPAQIASFRAFLLSHEGYFRLEDTYNPNEFRMAMYAGPFEAEMTQKLDAGSFPVIFNCKPQRFLKTGETVQTFTANGTITNPTRFPSQPLLKVYGKGTVGIGSTTITISNADGSYMFIDCEMMDCYYNGISQNNYVSFSGNDFPVLASGSNGITLGGSVTKVEITPRWWTV